LGLHVGEVLYGNIGVPERLEFSVCGPTANEVARLEGLTKTLHRQVLASDAFTALTQANWTAMGSHKLRGVSEPQPVYALD
jgi:adenylate cyclase